MSVDKLVDSTQLDSDLTSVANAIRAKSGGSSPLAFPSGFVSEIGNIPTGGGGDYVADDWLDAAKPVGEISSNVAFGQYANLYVNGRTGITKISLPNATALPEKFAAYCSALSEINAPNVTHLSLDSLRNTALQYAIFPKVNNIRQTVFAGCTSLLGVDFGGTPGGGFAQQNIFSGCSNLSTVILRGNAVWPLNNINDFGNTPFASGGSGGILYVPNSLISSYQSASNWSTILGYANNQIKKIEDSTYETHYVDGTTIPT